TSPAAGPGTLRTGLARSPSPPWCSTAAPTASSPCRRAATSPSTSPAPSTRSWRVRDTCTPWSVPWRRCRGCCSSGPRTQSARRCAPESEGGAGDLAPLGRDHLQVALQGRLVEAGLAQRGGQAERRDEVAAGGADAARLCGVEGRAERLDALGLALRRPVDRRRQQHARGDAVPHREAGAEDAAERVARQDRAGGKADAGVPGGDLRLLARVDVVGVRAAARQRVAQHGDGAQAELDGEAVSLWRVHRLDGVVEGAD